MELKEIKYPMESSILTIENRDEDVDLGKKAHRLKSFLFAAKTCIMSSFGKVESDFYPRRIVIKHPELNRCANEMATNLALANRSEPNPIDRQRILTNVALITEHLANVTENRQKD